MLKKLFFIYNPRAGKGKIRSRLADIIEIFCGGGYEVTVYATKGSGDATRVVRELDAGYDLLVCSGGDGTLDEVVTGMMGAAKKLPVGYIPAGSTNDFASSLGLPKSMTEAARVIVGGRKFPCDIGIFNEDIFVYIAAFGIFTDVSYETPQSYKNTLGHMAYILEGMKKLPSLRTYRLRVEYNGQAAEGEFLLGMITNSTSVGGFKNLTGKYVELNDGLFEIMLVRKPKNALELNQIITALVMENMDTECIVYGKADQIAVYSEEPLAWTLDGEYGGEHQSVRSVNSPHAVEILIP